MPRTWLWRHIDDNVVKTNNLSKEELHEFVLHIGVEPWYRSEEELRQIVTGWFQRNAPADLDAVIPHWDQRVEQQEDRIGEGTAKPQ